MKYELFVDKQEVFECSIKLEGASIDNAKARLVIESEKINLVFMGEIDKNGNCSVPIKKLKNILPEETEGKMTLEVIAEDTYFEPWESEFFVKASKSVKVEVKDQVEKEPQKKVIVEVKKKVVTEIKEDPYKSFVNTIVNYLKEVGVTRKNFVKNKKDVKPVLDEYFEKAKLEDKSKFIKDILKKL